MLWIRRVSIVIYILLALVVAIIALGQGRKPITENCGKKIGIQPATRVVTMNQVATEIMLALGLERRC